MKRQGVSGSPDRSIPLTPLLWCVMIEAYWIGGAVSAFLCNCFLHLLSEGRTSPLAAFSFVAFAAVGILVVGGPYVIVELNAQYARGISVQDKITSDDVSTFFLNVFVTSLILSACVTGVAAYVKRDTWFNHL